MKRLNAVIFLLATVLVTAFASAQSSGGDAAADGNFLERPDGARIHYTVTGSGEPMLLVHGYPLSEELFSKNRDALAATYQVITPTLRGYGMSEAPSSDATIETYANDMLALMDELGVQQAIIGGMSMGGPIVFEMYRQAPERFKGLILIDTIAAPAGAPEAGLWNGVAELVQSESPSALVPVLIKDMLSGDTRVNKPDQVAFLSNIIEQASVNGDVAGAKALANRPDSQPTLASITVPTLILVGLEDSLYPVAVAQGMGDAIVNSSVVVLDGAAHAAIYEAADQANQAILDWAQGIQ